MSKLQIAAMAAKAVATNKNVQKAIKAATLLVPIAKDNAPKVMNFVKDNPEVIEKVQNLNSAPKNLHHRKNRFIKYTQEILPNLATYNYLDLKEMIGEVKMFLRQIKKEDMNSVLKTKRTKKWNNILVQLEDYKDNHAYMEFLKLHRSTSPISTFFEDEIVKEFKKLQTSDARVKYIKQYIKVIDFDVHIDFK